MAGFHEEDQMQALLDRCEVSEQTMGEDRLNAEELNALVTAMGKRLQAEYVQGTIPYLREHEPTLWSRLEELDQEDSLEALLEYERLFFEGLRRYVNHLAGQQKAA
jgi:hypothetical protein